MFICENLRPIKFILAPGPDPIQGSPESIYSQKFWTPAFAVVTLGATFYEISINDGFVKS